MLFVCTGNSARSVMAEALLRHSGGAAFEVHSAGTEPKGVNPLTLRVLAEAGLDASWARSKSVTEFAGQSFDYVITVCDQARQACPVFPGGGAERSTGATRTRPRPRARTRSASSSSGECSPSSASGSTSSCRSRPAAGVATPP